MKIKSLRGLAAILLAGALLIVNTFSVAAADLQGETKLYLTEGDSPTIQYITTAGVFFNFGNVHPGDTLKQTITIENRNNKAVNFYLKTLSNSGNTDVLEKISLTISSGGAVIYRGDFSGKTASAYGNLTADYGMNLGTCPAGATFEMTAVVEIPVTLGNSFSNQMTGSKWEIRAQLPEPTTPVEPSNPGGNSSNPDGGSSVPTVPPSGDGGGGGNPGGGGGGGGATPDSDSTVPSVPEASTAVIADEDVPLADNLYNIAEQQVPKDQLPKTGGGNQLPALIAALSFLSVAVLIGRKKER